MAAESYDTPTTELDSPPKCAKCGQYLATVAGKVVCPDCDEDWIEDQMPRCEHDEDRACPSTEPCKRGECIRTKWTIEDEARLEHG